MDEITNLEIHQQHRPILGKRLLSLCVAICSMASPAARADDSEPPTNNTCQFTIATSSSEAADLRAPAADFVLQATPDSNKPARALQKSAQRWRLVTWLTAAASIVMVAGTGYLLDNTPQPQANKAPPNPAAVAAAAVDEQPEPVKESEGEGDPVEDSLQLAAALDDLGTRVKSVEDFTDINILATPAASGTPAAVSTGRGFSPFNPAGDIIFDNPAHTKDPTRPEKIKLVYHEAPVTAPGSRPAGAPTLTVQFELKVNPDGTVNSYNITSPSGDSAFDAAAGKAAMKWQFSPPGDVVNIPVSQSI